MSDAASDARLVHSNGMCCPHSNTRRQHPDTSQTTCGATRTGIGFQGNNPRAAASALASALACNTSTCCLNANTRCLRGNRTTWTPTCWSNICSQDSIPRPAASARLSWDRASARASADNSDTRSAPALGDHLDMGMAAKTGTRLVSASAGDSSNTSSDMALAATMMGSEVASSNDNSSDISLGLEVACGAGGGNMSEVLARHYSTTHNHRACRRCPTGREHRRSTRYCRRP